MEEFLACRFQNRVSQFRLLHLKSPEKPFRNTDAHAVSSAVSWICILVCLILNFYLFIFILFKGNRERETEKEVEIYNILVHSLNAHSTMAGPGQIQESRTQSYSLMYVAETQVLKHHLLLLRVHIKRKMDGKLSSSDSSQVPVWAVGNPSLNTVPNQLAPWAYFSKLSTWF